MKETFYERIGEAVCRERLTNGLEVCVVPKPGYAKKYAFFSTLFHKEEHPSYCRLVLQVSCRVLNLLFLQIA